MGLSISVGVAQRRSVANRRLAAAVWPKPVPRMVSWARWWTYRWHRPARSRPGQPPRSTNAVSAPKRPARSGIPALALAACCGVDQAAEPAGGVIDELDQPGVTSHRMPSADEDDDQVQVGLVGVDELGADQLKELVQRQWCLVGRRAVPGTPRRPRPSAWPCSPPVGEERKISAPLMSAAAARSRAVVVWKRARRTGASGRQDPASRSLAGRRGGWTAGAELAGPDLARWSPGAVPNHGQQPQAGAGVEQAERNPAEAARGPAGDCGRLIAQTTTTTVAVLVTVTSTVRIRVPSGARARPRRTRRARLLAAGTAWRRAVRAVRWRTRGAAMMVRVTGRRRGAGMAARRREPGWPRSRS